MRIATGVMRRKRGRLMHVDAARRMREIGDSLLNMLIMRIMKSVMIMQCE